MKLIERVQAILLRPAQTWPVIAEEPATTSSLYSEYLVFLAAIPAVAGFIGLTLVGTGAFGVSFHVPLVAGLVQMVFSFVISLLLVYVMALIVDALAPSFSGTRSRLAALKLVAYGATAGFVGGIFSLLPALSTLAGLLASVYSIYLIYLGIPVLMKCPQDKAAGYTAVVVICGIVAAIVIGSVFALATCGMGVGYGSLLGGRAMSIGTPDGNVTVDTTAMSRAAARIDAAQRNMDAAQKSGDTAATGKALGDMMGAITGSGNNAPIDAQVLKTKLPDAIGDLKRESFEASGGQAMGISSSSAKATYGAGGKHVQMSITDLGGLAGIAAMAGWANMTVDKETQDSIEKVYKQDGRTIHESYRKDGSHGEYTVILQNNVIVEAEGDQVDIATLKSLVSGIDLGGIESTKRVPKA